MAFPTTSVLDSFNRADETPLSTSGAWGNPIEATGAAYNLATNALRSGIQWAQAYRDDQTYGPDLEVFVTLLTLTDFTGGAGVELMGRIQAPGTTGMDAYMLHVGPNATDNVKIFRVIDQGQTQVAAATVTIAAGDTFGLEVLGTGATVTINGHRKPSGGSWSQMITFGDTDAARITAAGYIGVMANLGTATTNGLDDFGGGTVVVGGGGGAAAPTLRTVSSGLVW